MITTDSIQTLRAALQKARGQRKRIGLVPTMGNLHEGHISLLEMARQESEFIVTSLFVNPLQFGPQEDLQSYPRTPSADQKALSRAGCSVLFAPSVKEMYPDGLRNHCSVIVPGISRGLCGDSRPGHFEGVATVVTKLFNIVQPDVAVFGQKDYQQLAVICGFHAIRPPSPGLSGRAFHAHPATCSTTIRPGSRSAATQGWHC